MACSKLQVTDGAVYLSGSVWQRTSPPLTLLAMAVTANTLIASLAQFTAARSRGAPTAALSQQGQAQQAGMQAAVDPRQISTAVLGLASRAQAAWGRLSEKLVTSRSGAGEPEASATSAGGSLAVHPQRNSASEVSNTGSFAVPDADPELRQHIRNGIGNGVGYAPELDEWGRAVVQVPNAPEHVNGYSGAATPEHLVQQDSVPVSGAILWVRKDDDVENSPETNGNAASVIDGAAESILWHPNLGNGTKQAATQAAVAPLRLRRSRLHRHEVSIEMLLDNVE